MSTEDVDKLCAATLIDSFIAFMEKQTEAALHGRGQEQPAGKFSVSTNVETGRKSEM